MFLVKSQGTRYSSPRKEEGTSAKQDAFEVNGYFHPRPSSSLLRFHLSLFSPPPPFFSPSFATFNRSRSYRTGIRALSIKVTRSLGRIKGARGCTALWLQLRVGGCEGGRVGGDDGRSSLAFAPRKGSSKGGEHPPFKRGRIRDEVRGDRKPEKRTIRVFKSPTKFRLKS